MIAKMSKYDFVLFHTQSADFIEKLREIGLVDITTTGWEPREEDRQLLLDIEAHQKALDKIAAMREEEGRLDAAAKPFASGEEAFEHYMAAVAQTAQLNQEIARLEKSADELRPWGAFDIARVRRLAKEGIMLHFLFTVRSTYEKMLGEWSEQYTIEEISRTAAAVWFVVITKPGEDVLLDAQEMKTPQMDVRQVEERIAQAKAELKTMDGEFSRVAASESLLAAHAGNLKERLQNVRVEATATEAADGKLLVMEGWAEKDTSSEVDKLLEAYPNVVWIKGDPTEEDDTPVLLKNNPFARVFELVGDMYARPKYGTMDLTPFFAPFYMLFFGICLNDAGYGAVLVALGAWLLAKNRKPGMMRQAALFATYCGLMTTAFGLVCGSFFGVPLQEYFPSVPFYDFQGKFFSMSLAIGMVQVLFGQLLKIIMLSSTVGFKYALSTLGWWLILLAASIAGGLPIMNADWVIPFFTMDSVAFYVVVAIGAVLMLFFNSPGKNPFVNLGAGLWDTYNNLTGILSDMLSYIRLFAIGLSGGILATVFNSLADGFVPEGSGIVSRILIMLPVLLIGHGINLFMSVISSFVHPMRLTFVEFYKNAGFEMASRMFDPLRKMDK